MYFTANNYEKECISSEVAEESSYKIKEQLVEPSKRSSAWIYFSKREDDPNLANCNLCGQEVPTRNFGTTGLFSHLRRHHGEAVDLGKQPKPLVSSAAQEVKVARRKNRTNASPVWQHFSREPGKGACYQCGMEVAVPGGSTTGMFAHLRKYHPAEYRMAKSNSPLKIKSAGDVGHSEQFTFDLDLILPEKVAEVSEDDKIVEANNDIVRIKSNHMEHPSSLILEEFRFDYVTQKHTDLVFHCEGGTICSHKLVMAGLSDYLKKLFLISDQEEVHVHLSEIRIDLMEEFLIQVYSGQQTPIEEFEEIFDILRIFKSCEITVSHGNGDDLSFGSNPVSNHFAANSLVILPCAKKEPLALEAENDNTFEINNYEVSLSLLNEGHDDQGVNDGSIDDENEDSHVNNDDPDWEPKMSPTKTSVSVIEVPNLPNLEPQQPKTPSRTKKPSLIWVYFDKTSEIITCKTCGAKLKNSGNTTNAAHHLKQHSYEYNKFKNDCKIQKEEKERECEKLKEEFKRNSLTLKLEQSPIIDYFGDVNDFHKRHCKLCGQAVDMFDGSTSLVTHLQTCHPEEAESCSIGLRTSQGSLEWLWKWFEFSEREDVAVCSICKNELAVDLVNGAQHNLHDHIQSSHPEVYLENMVVMNKLEEVDNSNDEMEFCAKGHEKDMGGRNVESLFLHGDLEFNRVCKLCQTVVQAKDDSVEEMLSHITKDHPNQNLMRPVAKRKKKKLTAIWLYYSKGDTEDDRVCQICGIVVRAMNASTTGMIAHLRAYHPPQYSEWQKIRGSGNSGNIKTDKAGLEKTKFAKNTSRHFVRKRGRKANEAMLANAPEIRTCKDCGKVFSCRGAMQYHCRVVHSGVRPFTCEFCGKTFARKDSYDSHITQHNAVKPFMCQHCGKTFGRRHTRDVHERSHIGDRRYTCAYCPKKFMSGQQKIAHERVHTGEKPYQCTNCGKTFAQQHQLVTHFRIHSGEKPYHCPKCGQHFRHLSSHRNHRCPTSTPDPISTILVQNSETVPSDQEEAYREQDALSAQYRLTVSHAPVPALLKYC